jgi:peptidoglycan/LPS O-acetylase OafA/YrhL
VTPAPPPLTLPGKGHPDHVDPDNLLIRTFRFWVVAAIACILPVLSWAAPILIRNFNVGLFHGSGSDDAGGWLYVGVRFALVSILLICIGGFATGRTKSEHARRKTGGGIHFDPLMGLRAMACLLVVMGHYFMIVLPFSTDGVSPVIQALLQSCPWAGVWIFFTLSGYLMGKGFIGGRYKTDEVGSKIFWLNRALRIAPVYITCVLIVSAIKYPSIFEPRHLWMLVDVLLFDLHSFLPINPIAALWSVTAECYFYLLAPFLSIALLGWNRRFGNRFLALPVGLIALATGSRLLLATFYPAQMLVFGYEPTIPNLDMFVAGMCLNLLPKSIPATDKNRTRIGTFLIGAALFFYVTMSIGARALPHLHLKVETFWAFGPVLGILFAGIFIRLSEKLGIVLVRKGLFGQILLSVQGIGTLTYCIYVIHSDIFTWNAEIFPVPRSLFSDLAHFPLVMGETLAVSSLLYVLIERPFERRKLRTAP